MNRTRDRKHFDEAMLWLKQRLDDQMALLSSESNVSPRQPSPRVLRLLSEANCTDERRANGAIQQLIQLYPSHCLLRNLQHVIKEATQAVEQQLQEFATSSWTTSREGMSDASQKDFDSADRANTSATDPVHANSSPGLEQLSLRTRTALTRVHKEHVERVLHSRCLQQQLRVLQQRVANERQLLLSKLQKRELGRASVHRYIDACTAAAGSRACLQQANAHAQTLKFNLKRRSARQQNVLQMRVKLSSFNERVSANEHRIRNSIKLLSASRRQLEDDIRQARQTLNVHFQRTEHEVTALTTA
eukprot:TRINITY_DN5326_c0_g1_i1.p1 TRINITY_DN5326_c0_g1~~TRINITY_DN5326_c0_g1_i1.p1  ORF type:complete len:303 (+),score=38.66 TRINITY_DN5326_c0_g1_i1:82-990(+)